MHDKKKSQTMLIRDFFKLPSQSLADFMSEYKALTEQDKLELASGIARAQGLTPDQLDFTPVAY